MLTLVTGVVGLMGMAGAYTSLKYPNAAVEALRQQTSNSRSVAEDDAKFAISKVVLEAPGRRWLNGANLVVSGFLWVTGTMLLVRRKDAPLWMRQAAVANGLWVVADVALSCYAIVQAVPRLRETVEHALQASHSKEMQGLDPRWVMVASAAALVLSGLLRGGFFVWVFRRVGKADVKEWLHAPTE